MVVSVWQPTQRNMPERLDSENMSLNSPWNSLRESHLTTPSRSTGSPRMFLHKPASPSMLCRAVLARLPFSGPVSTKISSVLIIVVVFNTLAWHRGFPHVVWHNKHGSLKSSTQICHHPMFLRVVGYVSATSKLADKYTSERRSAATQSKGGSSAAQNCPRTFQANRPEAQQHVRGRHRTCSPSALLRAQITPPSWRSPCRTFVQRRRPRLVRSPLLP